MALLKLYQVKRKILDKFVRAADNPESFIKSSESNVCFVYFVFFVVCKIFCSGKDHYCQIRFHWNGLKAQAKKMILS